jgi:hypothetical protein
VLPADDILTIFGKTEGNGCVNDFTHRYALSVSRSVGVVYDNCHRAL